MNTKKDISHPGGQKLFYITCVYRAVLCQTKQAPHHSNMCLQFSLFEIICDNRININLQTFLRGTIVRYV